MNRPTLAEKLGTTTHLSALLQKARRLGLDAKDLSTLAVQSGCRHYADGSEPVELLVSEAQFPNEELAIALLSPALPYNPHSIRCGAAVVSAEGIDPQKLSRLAVMERCVVTLRYVADAGLRFEPENSFWEMLLASLPKAHAPKPGVLPHPTRFVAMTGYTPRGRESLTEWQRPVRRR
jgi:hypothetical protein